MMTNQTDSAQGNRVICVLCQNTNEAVVIADTHDDLLTVAVVQF